jgi:hypothetical protein
MRRADKVLQFLDAMAERLTEAEHAVCMCDADDPHSVDQTLRDIRMAVAGMGCLLRKLERRRAED